jgi:hypothetical protein
MYNVRVRTMQILAFAAAIGMAVPSMFAQAKRPPSQPAVQSQQINQQQNSNQAQATPGTAQSSLCANRPLCYEGNDFVATVTEFRTSTDPRGIKIIDAMMHFQNKTNQQISLGYVDGSGSAIDDMGNRLGLNTYNGGVRGMGIVAGNNVDPKFSLPPGGGGDARFELYWVPGGKLSGVNYEMELSIREMNRVEGNQWTLGDETLLHYQGLANGMGVAPLSNVNSAGMGSAAMGSGTGAVSNVGSANAFAPGQANVSVPSAQPMMAASGQPCPPGATTSGTLTNVANSAGAQNGTANNTVTNASAAISNLGSIFARKKKPAAAPATANAAAPCTPVANANAKGAVGTPVANTALTQPAAGAPAANTNGVMPTATATTTTTAPRAAVTTAVTRRTVASTAAQPTAAAVTKTSLKQPLPATTKTPAPAAKKPAPTPATTNGAGGDK